MENYSSRNLYSLLETLIKGVALQILLCMTAEAIIGVC